MYPTKEKQVKYLLNKQNMWNRWIQLGGYANLQGANLRGANLRGAGLWGADLWSADLQGANLRGADLRDANLWGADLWDADLWGADLRGTDLRGADLSNTCLNPSNLRSGKETVITILNNLGIQVNPRGNFKAYRTKVSKYVGNTIYTPGTYIAPVFSTDEYTDCHPGLYFTSLNNALKMSNEVISIVTNIDQVVAGPTKLRCKRFRVVKE
jgi:uncharacterized protein YjbI with pentapeptide repeats